MKLKWRGRFLCMAVAVTFFLSGCQQNEKNYLIIMPSSLDVNYTALETAAVDWADSHKVRLTIAAPELPSTSEQQQILDKYLDEDWDVICIEPLGAEELSPLLEYAHDKGTTVITMKSGEISCANYNIEPFSNEDLGKKMMDSLSGQMNEKGTYLTMVPSNKSTDTLDIENSAIEQQKIQYADMFAAFRLEQSGGKAKQAKQLVEQAAANYQIKGVLFFSTEEGRGIASWQQKQTDQIAVVGIGDSKLLSGELENGSIDVLFYWNAENLMLSSLQIGYIATSSENYKMGDSVAMPYDGYKSLQHTNGNTWVGQDIQITTSN